VDIRTRGATSQMVRVFIPDNSSTTGAGKTGLTNASTNLVIAYRREQGATVTYTGANIEDITTPGTYQAPTGSTYCRFKAVDATNFPGMYEIQFHDSATIFGAADASAKVQINIYEATTTALNIGPNMKEIQLTAFDLQVVTESTIAAALGARIAESQGNYTYDQILSILLSVLSGVTANAGKTFKTPNGVATRAVVVTDANNNRTSMTLTP
jgi:hypothetical protein